METFLNAMTILGMVLVGFILVVCVALGIMLAAGVFNKHYEPLVGLKFNKTDAQVILENEGTVTLVVTANTAEIYDGTIVDETMDTDIVLTVRNGKDVIDNSIIEVPRVVKKGEPFEIKAKLAADGSNVGGICYINAETSDMMYRVAAPIEVRVDVPVKEVTLLAKDAYTNEDLDLESTQFIYQDKAQLSVTVEPARSLYIFGDTTRKKAITYTSSAQQSAVSVGRESGTVDILYNPVWTTDDPLTAPADTAVITAKVQKYSITDPAISNTVSTEKTLGLYPLQLGEILIKNDDFESEGAHFETKLFSTTDVLKISAEETGRADIINLNIYLQPTIVKENRGEEYNPLSDLTKFEVRASFENPMTDVQTALDVIPQILEYRGKNVSYWTIEPNRLLSGNEKVYLSMNLQDKAESYAIKREVVISEVQVNKNTFEYTNATSGVQINSINLDIVKNDDDAEDEDYGSTQINYNFDSEGSSFKKVVHFVTKANGSNSDEHINQNEVDSKIIAADTGTLQLTNAISRGFVISPKGAGQVGICSYLVRTNKAGQPVDKNYDIITTDPAQASQNGYILASGFCKVADIEFALEGQYIVHQEFSQFTVTVREKLTQLTVYSDTSFSESKKINEFTMGTKLGNELTLYAKPNSTLAIPENTLAFHGSGSAYSPVELEEIVSEGVARIFDLDDLQSNITNTGDCYGNSGDNKYTSEYKRWFKFKLHTDRASSDTSVAQRTLMFKWKSADNSASYSKTLNVTTIDVPVDYITISDTTDSNYDPSSFGITSTEGYYKWQLYPDISDSLKHETTSTVGATTTIETKTYYRLKFVSQTSGAGDLILPACKSVASETYTDTGLIKVPSNDTIQRTLFLFNNNALEDNPITIGEATYNSIDQIMITLNSTEADVTAEMKQSLWQKVAKIMEDNEYTAKANDYAYISSGGANAKLFVKKALPRNHSLYLFYYSGAEADYQTSFASVAPIAVQIQYQWPTFTSGVVGCDIPNTAQTIDEYGVAYHIYYDDANKTRKFDGQSFSTSQMSYYDPAGNLNIQTVYVTRSITLPSTNYLTMNITTSDGEFGNNELLVFTLVQDDLAEETQITVSIGRKIYFSVMSDADWQSIKQNAVGDVIDDPASLSLLENSNSLVECTLETESLRFIVKQPVDESGGDPTGGDTPEGGESSAGGDPAEGGDAPEGEGSE